MLQCLNECEQQVKLIDFGIAKVIDSKVASDNDSTTVAGTISYMAPEQLMGKPSASSDVYALGVIAYEMLCGQKPFKPNTPYELLDMQREGVKDNPSDLRPDLPKAAETAILKALAFEQDVRHARARDFGEEMANALTLRASQSSSNENEIAPIPNDYNGAAFAQGEQVAEAGYFEIPDVTPKVVPDPLSQTGSFWSRRKSVAMPAIAILIALVAVALISQRLIKKPFVPIKPVVANDVSTGNAGLTRKLSYSVTLLRDPDTFPRSKPLRLPRETLFSMGDRIRLDIFSPQVGWLYILNERPAIEGETSKFNLMFPFPLTKQYSAEVGANQPVLVPGEGYFILDNEKGAERVWLIWSASRVPELDILKKWVNEKDRAEIKSADEVSGIRDFLAKYSGVTPVVEKDETLTQTNISASGDVLLHLITLAHRPLD
jgi:serine/threonine protein kinase